MKEELDRLKAENKALRAAIRRLLRAVDAIAAICLVQRNTPISGD